MLPSGCGRDGHGVPKEDFDRVIHDVGRRIAECRRDLGLTQEEFAERLGMAPNNLQRVELGMQNLTVRTLVRVAKALGVKTGELFEAPRDRTVKVGRPARLP